MKIPFLYVLLFTILIYPLAAESQNPPATTPASAPASTPATTVTPATTPAESTKVCFQCNGAGKSKCPSCVNGQADCPGPCLKISTPGWQKLNIAGHSPDELWMKYPHDDGSGWQAWSQKHVGQIVKRQNGKATLLENCPTCNTTGSVKCTRCDGSGISVCTMCGGSKVVPQSWSALDNPKMKNRPSRFKMKDGSEILGRKVIETQDIVTVRTASGSIDIKKSDLAPEEASVK